MDADTLAIGLWGIVATGCMARPSPRPGAGSMDSRVSDGHLGEVSVCIASNRRLVGCTIDDLVLGQCSCFAW